MSTLKLRTLLFYAPAPAIGFMRKKIEYKVAGSKNTHNSSKNELIYRVQEHRTME